MSFQVRRGSTLTPAIRLTDLPYSSPTAWDEQMSMIKQSDAESVGASPFAPGPGHASSSAGPGLDADADEMRESIGELGELGDWSTADGIADCSDSQWADAVKRRALLSQYMSDMGEVSGGQMEEQRDGRRRVDNSVSSPETTSRPSRESIRGVTLSISPSPEPDEMHPPSLYRSSQQHPMNRSDSPSQPITPFAPVPGGSLPIPWSSSPYQDREVLGLSDFVTKTRRNGKSLVVRSDDEDDSGPRLTSVDKGKARRNSPTLQDLFADDDGSREEKDEMDWIGEDEDEEDFNQALLDIDPDAFDPPSLRRTSGTVASPRRPRPPASNVPMRLDPFPATVYDVDSPDDPAVTCAIPLITDLDEDLQDFYQNHWRRGAEVEQRKQVFDLDKVVETSEKKRATAKRALAVRGWGGRGRAGRGGFRGRGRGRARKR